MNIFYLDRDPETCAQMHCDKHVIKMILESAQILSTAIQELYGRDARLYLPTHKNHPSTLWVSRSRRHAEWLNTLLRHLLNEYKFRYGKEHKTSGVHMILTSRINELPDNGWEDPPAVVPEDLHRVDVVRAYRDYYARDKQSIATWTNRKVPYWYAHHLKENDNGNT